MAFNSKIVITIPYGDDNFKKIGELGYNLEYINEHKIIGNEELEDVEILICYDPFKKIDLHRMPKLKWIQLVSKGINQVPVEAIEKAGILVTNNGNAAAVPISEWIISMIFFIFKNSFEIHKRQNNRLWQIDRNIVEINGQTIGFLGTGNIACETAKKLQAFGAVLLGVNRSGHPVAEFDKCFSISELETVLPLCDVVISTLPGTPETYHIINEKTLSMMKPGLTLINISRGSIIKESALIEKLDEGLFRGAALDVFESEPLSSDHPLWSYNNVIITPHNSFLSDKYSQRVFEVIYRNLKNYISKSPLENRIDFKKGY